MARVASPALRPDFEREHELASAGYQCIAGVDEAGRGPLAGPVVAAAVVLPLNFSSPHFHLLHDSKQLSASLRATLFEELTQDTLWGVSIIDAPTIDKINIRQASWQAMQQAVADLIQRWRMPPVEATKGLAVDYVLIDGLGYGPGPWPYEALVKGDARSLSIAAASVIAKETRDALMVEYDREFPYYGFAVHKGYGTAKHLQALREHGACPLHRRSFRPVREVVQD